MKDQADVCPLSWRVTLKPLSTRLQGGLRFFRHPVPAHQSVGLAARLPVWEMYGVATFRLSDTGALGSAFPPAALVSVYPQHLGG
jgi:hypothetical protein